MSTIFVNTSIDIIGLKMTFLYFQFHDVDLPSFPTTSLVLPSIKQGTLGEYVVAMLLDFLIESEIVVS